MKKFLIVLLLSAGASLNAGESQTMREELRSTAVGEDTMGDLMRGAASELTSAGREEITNLIKDATASLKEEMKGAIVNMTAHIIKEAPELAKNGWKNSLSAIKGWFGFKKTEKKNDADVDVEDTKTLKRELAEAFEKDTEPVAKRQRQE